MLTTLRIKNLALVSDLTLELQPGYNAITGETGAGKSIIIGGLNLVLGERADRTLIRGGADSCSVEAVFDLPAIRPALATLLEENGIEPCEGAQLVLKRTFTAAGTNRQFVNGSPTTLALLAAVGQWLVDMHGPHDHQSLLHPARQLAILDAFADLPAPREHFTQLVRRRAALEAEKSALIIDERTYAQQLELLRHQATEIAAAKLHPAEEAALEQEFHRASNSARLLQLAQSAINLLGEDDNSLLTQLGAVGRLLQEIHRIDAAAAPLAEIHEHAATTLRDLQADLTRYADRVEVDPARLQEMEERLNLLHSLKRKYGGSLADVLAFGEESLRQLHALEQRETELARLQAALEQVKSDLWKSGVELSTRRRKAIPKLAKAATRQLADLGFQQSHFDVALTTVTPEDFSRAEFIPALSGLDTLEFQFAPNPGEPTRPLRAIASSGEMARVMLALKTVLATEDEVPVLVFDEVDANVGGETANAVGDKMRQIARQHQVLCITHLAPVAAAAGTHFVVTKQIKDGRTLSQIQRLEKQSRIEELARMLGGQTDAARNHAEALLQTSAA